MIGQTRHVFFGVLLMICLITIGLAGCDSDAGPKILTTYRTTIDGTEYNLEYSVLRPQDDLPHPLVIFTHGRNGPYPDRYRNETEGYVEIRTALHEEGYVVMLLIRRGYGNSDGPDSELKDTSYESGLEASKDLKSAVVFMKTQSYVNPEKIVVMGQSQGGWAAIAFSTVTVEGVLGTVNISGGINYISINSDSLSTRHSKWIADCGTYGKTNVIPCLWIYSPNDESIPGDASQSMFDSFKDNGGKGTFIMKPAYYPNGHGIVGEPELFMSDILDFFTAIGMTDAS